MAINYTNVRDFELPQEIEIKGKCGSLQEQGQ